MKLTNLAMVRKKYPNAYAYNWGPREWTIYADDSGGPLTGISIADSTSRKGAWYLAAESLRKLNMKMRRFRLYAAPGFTVRNVVKAVLEHGREEALEVYGETMSLRQRKGWREVRLHIGAETVK